EDQSGILAEPRATVIVSPEQGDQRQAVTRKRRPRRVDRDLVHRGSLALMDGRGSQIAEALPLLGKELAIIVRVPRQSPNAQQLTTDEQVVVDRQFAPGFEA